MDTRAAQTIQKLMEQLAEAQADMAPVVTPEAEDHAPAPFAFSKSVDKVGLPFESADYVKKSCSDCYGRGFQTWLVGDGYRTVGPEPGYVQHLDESGRLLGERVPRKARNLRACRCVVKGYVRARLRHDREKALAL